MVSDSTATVSSTQAASCDQHHPPTTNDGSAEANATDQADTASTNADANTAVGQTAASDQVHASKLNGSTAATTAVAGEGEGEGDEPEDDGEFYSEDESDTDSEAESIDSMDRALDKKNRLFLVGNDGRILGQHFMSSYTKAELYSRNNIETVCMYDAATASELRQFVRDRRLADPYPQGLTLKYFYLRVLDRADKELSFKFLDLPPEMRNLIYVELLTFDTTCPCEACNAHRACETGILRANKQVYKEAKDILYAENTIDCAFRVATDLYQVIGRHTKIHNAEDTGYDTRINNVYSGMSKIPDWFHRIQSLHIDIQAHGHGGMRNARGFLQGCTLNLASFLLERHALKNLHIHVTNHLHEHLFDEEEEGIGCDLVAVVLYPFRRLSGLVNVKITGDVDESLSLRIVKALQRKKEPAFNTLPHLYKLRIEALAYLSMMETLNPRVFYGGLETREGPDQMDRLRWLLEETEYGVESDDEDNGEFEDSDAESNLRLKMEDMKACLDDPKFDKFKRQKKKFTDAQAARNAFASEQPWSNVNSKKDFARHGYTRRWDSRLKGEGNDEL